jgi:hypothetical protein
VKWLTGSESFHIKNVQPADWGQLVSVDKPTFIFKEWQIYNIVDVRVGAAEVDPEALTVDGWF